MILRTYKVIDDVKVNKLVCSLFRIEKRENWWVHRKDIFRAFDELKKIERDIIAAEGCLHEVEEARKALRELYKASDETEGLYFYSF